MTAATASFVQFPHPGLEHDSPKDEMPWNVDLHRRKFLISRGTYSDGRSESFGELVYWGEWEAQSTIVRRWAADGRMPRALHRPWWSKPGSPVFRQNTDPWIFGPCMLYSNCRQTYKHRDERERGSMQRLPRGSVICFGSTLDAEFCIDTVFVVASSTPWTPATVDDLGLDEAFKICTGESIATKSEDANLRLTLYRGATVDQPVEGMYSFVPARPADVVDPRFKRPSIRSKRINPRNFRQTQGSKTLLEVGEVRACWESVRNQTLDAGLCLGLQFETPPKRA